MNDRVERDFKEIENILNNFGFDETGVAEQLANTHPTLQQTFMRLCVEYIHIQAKKQYFDERNMATGKACKRLSNVISEGDFFFPFI